MTKDTNTSTEKLKRPQQNVHRTSITMPFAVRNELDRIRGSVSFSEQVVNDLNAYWEAVRAGMQLLRQKFDNKEAEYIAEAIGSRDRTSMKLSPRLLADIVEDVSDGPPMRGDLELSPIIEKLEGLSMLELLALVNWSRCTAQLNGTPEEAAADFRTGKR